MLYKSEYYGVQTVLFEPELKHHGIKGQKWGVRRFQNADGSLTAAGQRRYLKTIRKDAKKGIRNAGLRDAHTIPKGTIVNRVTTKDEPLGSGPKYVTYIESDSDLYRSGWTGQRYDARYEHTYQLTDDLKIPSRKELSDVTLSVMKEKKLLRETAEAFIKIRAPEGSLYRLMVSLDENQNYSEKNFESWKKQITKNFGNDEPDDLFAKASLSFGVNPKLKNEVISELKKRGYNAISDEAGIGGNAYNAKEGVDPLIIFDSSVMKEKGKPRFIDQYAQRDAAMRRDQWRRKVQKRMNPEW